MPLYQRCTPFLGQGPQCIILSALKGQRQNYELKAENQEDEEDTTYNNTTSIQNEALLLPLKKDGDATHMARKADSKFLAICDNPQQILANLFPQHKTT